MTRISAPAVLLVLLMGSRGIAQSASNLGTPPTAGQSAPAEPVRKAYPCYRMSSPVTIDGKLDEPAWKTLPEATGFLVLKSTSYNLERQTAFRMGWDDQAVYLGIRCAEPAAAELAAMDPAKRGGWGGEMLEFFFMRQFGLYRQFAVDVNAAVAHAAAYDHSYFALTDLPRTGVQAAAHVGANQWTIEVKFPFSCFDAAPKAGETWRFNIDRQSGMGSRKSMERSSACVYLDTHFHAYDLYADLQFQGGAADAAKAAQATAQLNAAYVAQSALQREAERRQAGLVEKVAAAKPIEWIRSAQEPLKIDTRVGLWDERRGHRYYGNLPTSFRCQWPSAVTINACRIVWFGPQRMAEDFGLEYWDGRAWRLVFHEEDNRHAESIKIFKPLSTTALRLTVFKATPDFETLRVRALDVYNLDNP